MDIAAAMKVPPLIINLKDIEKHKKHKKHKKHRHHRHHHHHHSSSDHHPPQPPGDQLPGDQLPGDQPPGDQLSGDQPPGDQLPGDQPSEDQPPEDQPSEDIPAKSTPQHSFLRIAEDGGVRLAIIGPPKPSQDNERVINLEQVCGQLEDGLDVLPPEIHEEEVSPIENIEQPAFGTHLPYKNSTFANLSGKDSELLLEIYGNPTCVDYAESIRSFAYGTNYPMQMADSLLNLLTNNQHEEVQKELNQIDELLSQLRETQKSRLSTSPSPVQPSKAETELAEKILMKLTKFIKDKARPADIVESSSILKAMGLDDLVK